MRIEISPQGDRLLFIVDKPLDAEGLPLPVPEGLDNNDQLLRAAPNITLRRLDNTLVATASLLSADPGALQWRLRVSVPNDGVFRIWHEPFAHPDYEYFELEHVLVMLRLQRHEAGLLLLPQDDYNEGAADLETWLAAATLAYEQEAYADADYILRELFMSFVATY